MMRTLSLVAMVALAALSVSAQVGQMPGAGAQTPVVTGRGEASVDAAPSYAEFWLEYASKGSTVAEAVEALAGAGDRVAGAFEEAGAAPVEVEPLGAVVSNIQTPQAHVEVRVRFALPADNDEAEAAKALAAASDAVAAVARATSADELRGPQLGVEDRESVERAAVGQAMVDAFPAAEAAANSMRAQLSRVAEASIESVTWNADAGPRDKRPTALRVVCTAVVRVSYMTAAQ